MQTLVRYSFDDGTYSHAFLIPIITAYLFYVLWQEGKLTFSEKINYPILVLLAISALSFIQVYSAQISLLYWTLSLGVLALSTTLIFNNRLIVFAACCYLVFLFPIWNGLTTPLQQLSTWVSSFVLSLTSIPIYVEGAFISLPAGKFEIANGCSGLRYLLVSLAISYLYTFLYIKSVKNSVTFLIFAILGALITNWIRIILLILIGQYTEMQSPLMTDHNNFGWFLYLPFLIVLFFLGNRLSTPQNQESCDEVNDGNNDSKASLHLPSTIIATMVLTLSASFWFSFGKAEMVEASESLYEPKIFNYSGKQKNNDGDTVSIHYSYQCGDLDCKPTFHENNLVPNGWRIVSTDRYNDKLELVVRNRNQYAKVTAWYQLDQYRTGKASAFKLQRLKQFPFSRQEPELHWQLQKCPKQCK